MLAAASPTQRSNSVREIAKATLQVARGDQTLKIARLARRDELGIIVESLGAFQANIARVNFLAHHDPLTTLPNRVSFQNRIGNAVAQAARGRLSAVLCLDLDHFKTVNDTLGHAMGDALLQLVAERLMGCVRDDDLVSRLGGDEFAIIQSDIATAEDAGRLAQRVIECLSEAYAINGQNVCVGVSVGIVVLGGATEDTATAMKNADLALYQAKADGRGMFCFFDPSMNESLLARRALELDLRLALSLDQFELFYQPLIGIASGQVSGFEALLRWRHPTRGLVSPLEFIPICEETGMIHKIGAWVIDRACRDAAQWPGRLNVAVNLSAVQFKNADLVAIVSTALAASGLPAQRLELEITELVLLLDSEATLAILHKLRALNLRISMDDFGTGYSSLSYLQSFPFDKIKIDQSFVRNLTGTDESVAIIRAVTGLSRSSRDRDGRGRGRDARAARAAAQRSVHRGARLSVRPPVPGRRRSQAAAATGGAAARLTGALLGKRRPARTAAPLGRTPRSALWSSGRSDAGGGDHGSELPVWHRGRILPCRCRNARHAAPGVEAIP